MPFGPIIDAELIRLSRQRRWYVLRAVLGLGMLLLLYLGYQEARDGLIDWDVELDDRMLTRIAWPMLVFLLVGQSLAVLVLVPMLTAGAIAEEKQRKTLHYLLASRLSGAEIVVGKLAARLLLALMPIAMMMPMVVLFTLLGKVELWVIAAFYGGALSTAVFEASLAILVSTLARRGRDALLLTFVLGLAWFFGPLLLRVVMTSRDEPWPTIYARWIEPVNDHLLYLSPFGLLGPRPTAFTPAMLPEAGLRMAAHQAVGTLLFLALATWQLRPAFRRQDGAPSRRAAKGRIGRLLAPRWRSRPPVGDAAMIWKELHATPGYRLVAAVSWLATAVALVLVYQSLRDAESSGRDWIDAVHSGRVRLSREFSVIATGLFCVWGLLLTVNATTAISREREDDTWISLISTPLDGRDILRAKLLGVVRSCRHLAYAILMVLAFGLAIRAFHPLGALIGVAQLAAFGLFIVAAGTLISLKSKTTSFAIGAGVWLLLSLSLLAPMVIAVLTRGDGPLAGVVSMPWLFALGLSPYRDPDGSLRGNSTLMNTILSVTIGSLAYLAIGLILLAAAYRRFDRALDRPRRGLTATPAARAAAATASPTAGPA